MKTIIILLTVSTIFLASVLAGLGRGNREGNQDSSPFEKTVLAQNDVRNNKNTAPQAETVRKEVPARMDPAPARSNTTGDELMDAVRRKDKEAAREIVNRRMQEKKSQKTDAGKWDRGNSRGFDGGEDEEDED